MKAMNEYELTDIIVDIEVLNEGDSVAALTLASSFSVTEGIENYLKMCELTRISDEKEGISEIVLTKDGTRVYSFLITDNRRAADIARANGIGISVYTNSANDASGFKEALYCIDQIADMSDETLNRMYERLNNIPWTITETERYVIRAITPGDVDRLYEIYADEETKKYTEDLYEDREQEIEYTKEYIKNQYRFYEYGVWAVIDKKSDILIGRAGVFDRENQDRLELGFLFEKSYWGNSTSTEVLSAIIQYAKDELNTRELLAHTREQNIRAKKLLEKLGFSRYGNKEIDGILYEAYLLSI